MLAPRERQATCLGCGCACDDIELIIEDYEGEHEIIAARNLCALGDRWFGDGMFPTGIRRGEKRSSLDEAIAAAGERLVADPASLLIFVGDDLSIEAQRDAIALADILGASIDSVAAETAAPGLLASARRGRVSGTLGALRHRADLVLWWGCDSAERYPRFRERFIDAPSRFVTARREIAIDLGGERGPSEAGERIEISAEDDVETIGELRAVLGGRLHKPRLPGVAPLVEACREAQNIAIIYDAEPGERRASPDRAEALLALGQQLFETRRAAVWGLRAGGNRNGFEAALTWQAGFPMSVDFSPGHPAFVAGETLAQRLARGRYTSALILGESRAVPREVLEGLAEIETIAIGPGTTQTDFHPSIAIETGCVGIHEAGLILRMDDVPLEVDAPLAHPHSVREILDRLVQIASSSRREAG